MFLLCRPHLDCSSRCSLQQYARSYGRTFLSRFSDFFSLNFFVFPCFPFFFFQILECEAFQTFCPLVKFPNFGNVSCFSCFSCFSWNKKRKIWKKKLFDKNSPYSNFELVFVSRIPQIRLKKSVTEILLRRSCCGDSVTETPTHFNPYRFRQTLSTTHRRLMPCKGYLNTHQT